MCSISLFITASRPGSPLSNLNRLLSSESLQARLYQTMCRHMLSIRERLELFISVCQTIQHAHQKAVLHLDLKPSHILVATADGKPVPKVIGFGMAAVLF